MSEEYFYVITKQGTTKLNMKEILYFEKERRLVHVYTRNGLTRYYGSFKSLIDILGSEFYRCHAGFIVNLSKIEKMERYCIHLEGEIHIPVSQRKYPKTKESYINYIKENFSCNLKGGIV